MSPRTGETTTHDPTMTNNPNDETAPQWLSDTEGAQIARDNAEGVSHPRSVEVELDLRVRLRVPENVPDEELKHAALWRVLDYGTFEFEDYTVHDPPEMPDR